MSYATFQKLGKDVNNNSSTTFKVDRVTSEVHRKKIISENLVVLIDNYTDWCGPCKTIAPKFAQLAKKYAGKCYFLQENNDDEFEGSPPVTGVPCFHFYINGNFVNDMTVMGGDIDAVEDALRKILEKLPK